MRVAAIQTTAGPDTGANLDVAATLVAEAVAAGARLVVLPEYFSVAGSPRHLRAHAETLTGPTMTWAAALAAEHRIHLVAGSVPERPADGGTTAGPPGEVRLSNTSAVVGPTGRIEAVYRKIHLFDVDLPDSAVRESATFSPGDQAVTVDVADPDRPDTPPPRLGLSICYDLRFPELYRILALDGADAVVVPAAFTTATGPAHWELLLRARAVENQVFVIAAGQVGTLPPGMPPCHGHSMIVDPWGTVLAERTDGTPGVVVAELDRARLEQVRAAMPVLAHRHPSAYRWPDDGRGDAPGPDR
jgi:predicted amidohydrolase